MSRIDWGLLALAALGYLGGGFLPRRRGLAAAGGGWLFHGALFALRWSEAGHFPVLGSWETALAGAWLLAGAGVALEALAGLGVMRACLLMALALLVWGLCFPLGPVALTISETSLWVDLHAIVAWGALAAYAVAAAAALRSLRGKGGGREERRGFRAVRIGFVLQSAMMAAGVYYQTILFARWWRWDPVESLSLASWLAWGVVLHGRRFYRWQGGRWSWGVLSAFVLFLVSYKVVAVLPAGSTYHQFDLTFGR